jgi:protein TonB
MIDKEGNFTDFKIRGAKKVSGGEILEDEARRIFSKMPRITPGKQRGKPVKVRYTYPLNFTLSNQ